VRGVQDGAKEKEGDELKTDMQGVLFSFLNTKGTKCTKAFKGLPS
jgi:hypothetical protein